VTGSDGDQEPEDVGVVESSSFYLASFTMVKLKHPTGKKKKKTFFDWRGSKEMKFKCKCISIKNKIKIKKQFCLTCMLMDQMKNDLYV